MLKEEEFGMKIFNTNLIELLKWYEDDPEGFEEQLAYDLDIYSAYLRVHMSVIQQLAEKLTGDDHVLMAKSLVTEMRRGIFE